mmetsp:Transcript_3328/g.10255  ORF Transcript_3328/g.10255 Transcript_3328/m.10255 type:complete len:247 (+) Transcript_3328:1061-1801(+)
MLLMRKMILTSTLFSTRWVSPGAATVRSGSGAGSLGSMKKTKTPISTGKTQDWTNVNGCTIIRTMQTGKQSRNTTFLERPLSGNEHALLLSIALNRKGRLPYETMTRESRRHQKASRSRWVNLASLCTHLQDPTMTSHAARIDMLANRQRQKMRNSRNTASGSVMMFVRLHTRYVSSSQNRPTKNFVSLRIRPTKLLQNHVSWNHTRNASSLFERRRFDQTKCVAEGKLRGLGSRKSEPPVASSSR